MGDGSVISEENRNPKLTASMISPEYLEYVNEKFGVFSGTVSLKKTAAEQANRTRESGFSLSAKEENYNDVYQLQIMRHPELKKFREWYDSGEKVWPNNIDLTPIVLKHWYCGDGHYNNHNTSNHIEIAMSNEVENLGKVDNMFERAGLPSPSNYNIYERENGYIKCDAVFSVEESFVLWEYMGEPLPDFRYKWPVENIK